MASFPGQRAGAPPVGPTTPSSLNAVMVGLNVQLTWSPSQDGDVPISYIIYRCAGVSCSAFSQLAVTPTGASSYTDNTAASFTSYSYRIQATDGNGNQSGFSNISTLTTPDTTAPSVPVLSFTNNNNAVQLSWTPASDPDDLVTRYNISRSVNNGPFTLLTFVSGVTTSYTDSTIQAGSGYQYYVTAQDSNGNVSSPSNIVVIASTDVTPPSVPTGLVATPVSSSQINLSWIASTDTGSGVKNYTIFRNSVSVATVTVNSFSDTGLSNYTTYTYTILATDNANNSSAQSTPVTAQTLDQIAPTVPGTFSAVSVSSSEIDLSWTASTDQGSGVSFYTITRSPGNFTTQVSTLSYKDVGLTAATIYNYTISATDSSGNKSSTASTSATTQGSQSSSFAPNFPRIAFNGIGTTTDDYYNNVTVSVQRLGSVPILQAYAKYNIFVLGGDGETWSTNATPNRDRQVLVNNIKYVSTANLGTKVLIYGDGNQYAVSGSAYPTWVAGITANRNWTLYNNATVGSPVATPAPDANGVQNVIDMVNYAENSSGTPFGGLNSNGESPYQWTAHYQFYAHLNKSRSGTDAGRFSAIPVGDSATNLDGIQFDNMWVDPRVTADWQCNGTTSTKDNGAYQGIWSDQLAKGQRDFCDTLANLISAAGQNQWLCGNAGDYGHTELGNTLTTAGVMKGVLNSSYFESAVGKSYSMDTQQSYPVVLADYFQMYDFLKDPNAIILNFCIPNGTTAQSGNLPFSTTPTAVNGEYQWARYSIATALMGDGYASIQRQTSGYNANGTDLTWYDEFDNAGALTGWLGQAIDPRQTSIRTWYDGTTIPNVYAREYQNGIAICVAKTGIGTATQPTGTITISGAQLGIGSGRSWNYIAGSQAPAVNKGGAVTSAGVTLQASRDGIILVKAGSLSLLSASSSNPRWLADTSGKAILLTGSHSWDSFQDTDTSVAPATIGAIDFNAYVSFLTSHGQNCTILWKKDLPTYFNWGAGGTWRMAPHPWSRVGPGNATDGLLKFDLNTLYQPYFDRLRARVSALNQSGIYAIVALFDGLGINYNRGSADGYPFTGANNINGIDDGYTSGTSGTGSMTMSAPNAITAIQVTYIKKVIDTLNDLPNVIWEISEEAPDNSTWWQGYMIGQIKTYEATKPQKHPVLFPTLDTSGASDSTLYNSNADVVAPKVKISPANATGTGTPATKVSINDSDHTYFSMWNDSTQTNRNSWAWPNFCQGNGVLFMDPYLINWANRNAPGGVVNGVGTTPDTRWNNLRDNLGRMAHYSSVTNLAAMSPNGSLSSTGYCLASPGSEYIVYCPNAASSGFTVDLSASSNSFNLEWFDCNTLAVTSGGTVSGGGVRTLTGTSTLDMVAYLKNIGSSDPRQQPLIQTSDISYLGSFTLPTSAGGVDWTFGGQGIGIGPLSGGKPTLLFCANGNSFTTYGTVGQFTIPAIGGTASLVSSGSISLSQRWSSDTGNSQAILGTHYDSVTNKILVSGIGTYSNPSQDVSSMASGSSAFTNWTTPQSTLNTESPRLGAGKFGPVPPEWQALMGGNRVYSVQSPHSIDANAENGCGLFTFDPAAVNGSGSISVNRLIHYPYNGTSTFRGNGSGTSLFIETCYVSGAAWIPNTRSVVFFGQRAMGSLSNYYTQNPFLQCYGLATACSDPCQTSNKGFHGYPYRINMWIYDMASVMGAAHTYDTLPYIDVAVPGNLGVNGCFDQLQQNCGGAYDPVTSNFYLSLGDQTPTIHVFHINHP